MRAVDELKTVNLSIYLHIYLSMIQHKVLTAGHPTLCFCYNYKPFFVNKDLYTVKVTIFKKIFMKNFY